MNTNSPTTLPCAGCSRYLGEAAQSLVVDFDGWRYRVCGPGCADRLMAWLSRQSTTSTSATNDMVNYYMLDGYRRWP